jgi:hypothetical protein
MEHEREQALRLGRIGQEPADEPPEPDRFPREPLPSRVGARDVFPAAAIGEGSCNALPPTITPAATSAWW